FGSARRTIHVGAARLHTERAVTVVYTDRVLRTIGISLAIGYGAITAFVVGVANEIAPAVVIVVAVLSESTITRNADLSIRRAAARRATDEVRPDAQLTEFVLIVRVRIGVDVRAFTTEKAHHHSGRLEGATNLMHILFAFSLCGAAVVVSFALVSAVALIDTIQAYGISRKLSLR